MPTDLATVRKPFTMVIRRGVDKDQTGRVQRCLVFPPGLACRFDVRAVLFGGVQGFFLKVTSWRRKNRHRHDGLFFKP